jgi:predicted dienelactone hydrolase
MPRSQSRHPYQRAGVARALLGVALVLTLVGCAAPPPGPGAPAAGERVAAAVDPSAGSAPAALPDPAARGPYAVGVTRREINRPSSSTGLPRTQDVAIWYPAEPAAATVPPAERLGAPLDTPPERSGQPYPLVLSSPGAGGGTGGSTFLTTHLASHGFVVAVTSHAGTTPPPCPSPCASGPDAPPEVRAWLEEAYANRPDDVRAMLRAMLEWGTDGDPGLAGLVDAQRIGVSGGSWGGSTAIQAVDDEPRYRAVVALAPAGQFDVRARSIDAVSRIGVPTMIVAGEQDHLVPWDWMQGLYAAFPANGPARWLVSLPSSGHALALDFCPDGYPACEMEGKPREQARINRWATVFLRYYVAGDARYGPLLDPALAASDPDLRVAAAGRP